MERELKLIAPQGVELPSLADAVPGLVDGVSQRRELEATYYDSKDLALARAGVTLRFRGGEPGAPWTVKLPERAGGAGLTRAEFRIEGESGAVPAEARDLVRAYLRARRLRPVARLHTVRTCVPLLNAAGVQVAEVVDDLVTAHRRDESTVVFREVEIELSEGQRRDRLERAALKRLRAAGCTTETPRPRLVRALGEAAERRADLVVSTLDAKPTVFDVIRHSFAVSVDRLVRHDAGVRLGVDPEDVHQFRVAARTLRSNLKAFAPLLEPEWAGVLRTELGWLGTTAGALRDLDVLHDRLRRMTGELGEQDTAAVSMLLDRVLQQREQARKATLIALRCHRYDSLLEAVVRAAVDPQLADDANVDAPARGFLRRAARTQVTRLDRTVGAVSSPPTDADLHRVRIQAKRTRYAIEAARPVIGRPAVEHAAALADLQDVLGEFHDSTVAVQWLRDAALAQPRCGLAAGQLVAAEHSAQADLREQVHGVWRAAAAKSLRAWL